jgi:DNA-binding NarL/FixJ family response regulator
LLNPERAARVCTEAISLGVLEERDSRLEFHPLAAAFLERQGRHETTDDIQQIVDRCLTTYRRRSEWDAAFELVDRYGTADDLEVLFSEALEGLLNAARLATIETWIERARVRQISSATIDLARAELALRAGRHLSAETYAQSALALAGGRRIDAWRAAMVAGRAAHTGSREESALEFYRAAEQFADSSRGRRDALWGQLMTASALELDETHDLLESLESNLDQSDRYELVRMTDKRLGAEVRLGAVRSLARGRRTVELVEQVGDPFARCSFRCNFAYSLILSAFYDEAYQQAALAFSDAVEFRVDPVLTYAHSTRALSLAGLGRFEDAHRALDDAVKEARRCHDDYGIQNVFAIRMRILVEEGRAGEACKIEPPDLTHSLRSMRGEVLSSRGLALVTVGRLAEASSLAAQASAMTSSVESRVLADAVEAIVGIRTRTNDWRASVERLVDTAFDSGGVDLMVAAYRGNPELLEALVSSQVTRERATYTLARAGDEILLQAAGLSAVSDNNPTSALSPREREVYELLCEGLSNGEIATRLFITEGTVKVHVHHVFDKLGVRSRTALAINAVRDRRVRAGQSEPH